MSSTVADPMEDATVPEAEPSVAGTIVAVDGLKKVYRSGWLKSGQVQALSGVTLHADAGQVFGLLGPNGAGKTTLIKILLGVIRSTGGSASLFGLPAGSAAARRRVGYLPESLRVDRHHTARTALKYYGRLSGLDAAIIQQRSDELLKLVGLEGRDRESVKRFSKGMLQRLGLAQALMHDPDLLVLDEPTDGLDPVGRSEVRRVIERLRDSGKTIFLNSHILHEVELVCTHLAIMAKGRVLASGPIGQLSGPGLEVPTSSLTIHMDLEVERSRLETLQSELEPMMGSDAAWQLVRSSPDTDRWRVQLSCDDQSDVDATVDVIREYQASILMLQPHRHTLEDTFMQLVRQAHSPVEPDVLN
ncbi:ABC transporter ATP-binding protein [Rhodopirellula halodulae]|uniref:ABC transporter ATP-binding protein n=1 Tax=Rhodopirellula halodulae TaxID=2894198 RepID=UPI001E3F88D5|nr:ABC transporter ATP-binding protein [Rhodopirellula sp. JC737]MCC9658746.1 ABC transporter ATP-binding protein [Rhodopirellula sp. JC737]